MVETMNETLLGFVIIMWEIVEYQLLICKKNVILSSPWPYFLKLLVFPLYIIS